MFMTFNTDITGILSDALTWSNQQVLTTIIAVGSTIALLFATVGYFAAIADNDRRIEQNRRKRERECATHEHYHMTPCVNGVYKDRRTT